MDDTPAINDGADTSLRKTVSLLNKIEAKTVASGLSVPVSFANEDIVTGVLGNPYTSNILFSHNPSRKFLFVQNKSNGVLYLKLGDSSNVSEETGPNLDVYSWLEIPPYGGGVVFNSGVVPTNSVYVGTSTGAAFYLGIQK